MWLDLITHISKIALDKNSKKLGTIVDVQKNNTNIDSEEFIIVQKSFLSKPSVHISFKIERILKTDDDFVWINVKKSDFDAWVKQLILHRDQQAKVVRSINPQT